MQRSIVLVFLALFPLGGALAERPDGAEAWLGVFLRDAVDGGAQLVAVVPGGPADHAGLREGDVVLAAGEARVAGVDDLSRLLAEGRPGDSLRFRLIRAGRPLDAAVRLAARPSAVLPAPPVSPVASRPESPPEVGEDPLRGCSAYGLYVSEVTPDLRRYFGAPAEAGVLVTGVDPRGAAAISGMRAGDVLVRLGERAVREVGEVEALLARRDLEGHLEASLIRAREPFRIQLRAVTPEASRTVAASASESDRARAVLEEALRLEVQRLQRRIERLQQQLEALQADR